MNGREDENAVTSGKSAVRTKAPGASLRKAINDKCRDCSADSESPGTWKEQIQVCSCTACPLWPVRPVSGGAGPSRLLLDELAEDIDEDLVLRLWRDPFDPSPWTQAWERRRENA